MLIILQKIAFYYHIFHNILEYHDLECHKKGTQSEKNIPLNQFHDCSCEKELYLCSSCFKNLFVFGFPKE